MGDILKEAIADAKAVRETALENAKMALEEAFTPQIKSMLSAKLKEEEDDDKEEGMHDEGEHEEGMHDEGEDDDEAEEKPAAAKKALIASRTNTLLSLPMLLSMVAAQNLY